MFSCIAGSRPAASTASYQTIAKPGHIGSYLMPYFRFGFAGEGARGFHKLRGPQVVCELLVYPVTQAQLPRHGRPCRARR